MRIGYTERWPGCRMLTCWPCFSFFSTLIRSYGWSSNQNYIEMINATQKVCIRLGWKWFWHTSTSRLAWKSDERRDPYNLFSFCCCVLGAQKKRENVKLHVANEAAVSNHWLILLEFGFRSHTSNKYWYCMCRFKPFQLTNIDFLYSPPSCTAREFISNDENESDFQRNHWL